MLQAHGNLTDEQARVIATVEKLLRLAGGTSSEAEASAATEKAMALLAAHNLDMASVGKGEEASRQQSDIVSGGYAFQRNVYHYVADLNFCIYWHETVREPRTAYYAAKLGTAYRTGNRVRIVGRKVNVISTLLMAEYLLQAIERLTKAYIVDNYGTANVAGMLRSRAANSFREGCAGRIVEKVWARRQQMIREQEAAARKTAEEAAARGASTANAVTLTGLRTSEHEANMEFLYPGYTARAAAQRAAREEAERAYAAWAAANPEEAKKREAEAAKEANRRSRSRGGPRMKTVDAHAYAAGSEAGAAVSIDAQVTENAQKRLR